MAVVEASMGHSACVNAGWLAPENGRNSIKMYDKQGSVLRVKTTVNDPRDMKVFRAKEIDPDGPMSWLSLRKGVA